MNDNLQKLVKQATHNVLGVQQVDSIILAESIIQECVNWINDNVGLITVEARQDLLKHFGINK